ncbi:MAG TPA: YbaK/EbsC family protein [Pirellulaceae bacterium]|nr:YbaK/EbsC family protein [Pirellulaceae bacterium]
MAASCFQRLESFLTGQGIALDVRHHAPVYTSEEAAQVRGTSLASGAKALVCKADERFVMIVLPADRKLASKLARKTLGIKSLRFASREEVEQLTGLTPGSIPPFGSLFGLPTWCDEKLAAQERINFNAGDHSISISMTFADYITAEQPQMGSFAE